MCRIRFAIFAILLGFCTAADIASTTITDAINAVAASWTTNNNSKTYNPAADPNPLTTSGGNTFLVADGVTAVYTRVPGQNVGTYHITATLHSTYA